MFLLFNWIRWTKWDANTTVLQLLEFLSKRKTGKKTSYETYLFNWIQDWLARTNNTISAMPLWCKSIEIQETQISWIYYRAESVALEKLYKKERWHIRNISKFTQLGKFKKLFFTQQTCSEWWQHENWVLEMKNGQT